MPDKTSREVYAALFCRRLTKPLQNAARLLEAATGDRPRTTTELAAFAADYLGISPEAVLDMTANELVARLQQAAFTEPLKANSDTPPPSTSAPPAGGQEGGKPVPVSAPDRPRRDPNKPSRDRQDDILAAIRDAKTPLTRSELIHTMKLKTEGKLGANLAWMVANGILINIPQRGYWPADDPVPE